MTVIKGIYIFFSVASDRKYIRVFELLAHLSVGAYLAVLPRGLYCYNLSLSKELSCLNTTAFYKVFVEFPFGLLQIFKREKVDINKRYK